MEANSPRWKEITTSPHPWEREAVGFVRERLPDHDPYRAWSNFEFIAEDGSINEVDLLVLTPKGFFLVEIKSRPGIVEGDAGTWSWHLEGRVFTDDNPLLLANRKAKKLVGLLKRQKSMSKVRCPFLEAHVFLSHDSNRIQLPPYLCANIHLTDRPAMPDRNERKGIIAALTTWPPDDPPRQKVDKAVANAISRAVEEAGIRPSVRSRRIGDYQLEDLLFEGPNYQDWSATHVSYKSDRVRIRLYSVHRAAGTELRQTVENAARREFSILSGILHAGILRPRHQPSTDRGPALVFEHYDREQRFDHYLAERLPTLTVGHRLELLRQLAETVRYAHDQRLIHRALCPQSILVVDKEAKEPKLQIFNWQTAAREPLQTHSTSGGISATSHVDQLIENAAAVYMAPEALSNPREAEEEMDIFSLGAIAYHLFTGQPPATSFYELTGKLREDQGLRVSSVLNGAPEELEYLVRFATHPEVTARLETVPDFLDLLDDLEEKLTEPDRDGIVEDPNDARQGDRLDHGITVKRRLGKGGSAIALLVERNGREQVLKVALDSSQNDHLIAEAAALRKLRHQFIVELHDELRFGDRVGLLLSKAGEETLADRIREEGRIALEHLERWGDDLLQTLDWLEQQGVYHRDIKPHNLGVTPLGKGDQLHLVLFDFSLTGTPPESISSGTRPYLDPFISLTKKRRWDPYAERFAAGVTLYQMATGVLPVWGDEKSDPAVLNVEVTLEPDAFEPALRERMAAFFGKALRRNYEERFDNAREMLQAWREIFANAGKSAIPVGHSTESGEPSDFDRAGLDTQLAVLGFSTRAMNALERVGAVTVEDLLRVPLHQLLRMRGVGSKTRREIADAVRQLTRMIGPLPGPGSDSSKRGKKIAASLSTGVSGDASTVPSIDELAALLLPTRISSQEKPSYDALRVFLRLDGSGTGTDLTSLWPSQAAAADEVGVTRARIGQILGRARTRWLKLAEITQVRDEIVALLEASGGVMTGAEITTALLARRGSKQSEPLRTRAGLAVTRACLEAERDLASPRWIVRRPHSGERILIARDELDEHGDPRIDGQRLAEYAERLGREADELAKADPLLPPDRVLERLQALPVPSGELAPAGNRLYQLAATTSETAALSSRFEVYPKGMPAERALRLSLGALAGAKELDVAMIQERVAGRYPEAEPLPGRPRLDELLAAVGSELQWRPDGGEHGAFVSRFREFTTVASGTSTRHTPHVRVSPAFEELTEEEAERKQFQKRLEYAFEQQHFLALVTSPKRVARVQQELTERFELEVRSFDEMLIRHMREFAKGKNIDWTRVLAADAVPPKERAGSRDWANLQRVVRESLSRVHEDLGAAVRHPLVTNLGLLARYEQLSFLDALRDGLGRDGPGVWLLIATDAQEVRPTIDGRPVPVFTTAQWARVPEPWIAGNGHPRPLEGEPT